MPFRLLLSSLVCFSLISCTPAPETSNNEQQRQTVRATGQLAAATFFTITPPSVGRLWQYNIKEMAPEGSLLQQGMPVIGFDSQSVQDELRNKNIELRSAEQELANRLTADEQRFEELKLQLAERKNDHDREQRKAEIVDNSRSANDRRKSQIDFTIAKSQYQLAQSRLDFHQQQRDAEQQIISSKIARLSAEVEQLKREVASLKISAPFAGIMVYVPNYNGEKSSVGDTVQFGQPIAEVSQLESLYIKTEIDEVDLKYLRSGLTVQITLDAYPERNFSGVLTDLGTAVRNKTAENLSRVVDASIKLDETDLAIMRPGMSARLQIRLAAGGE
ncbi:HlyD family secretion protein [Alishewanella sp. HL-SH05]|uniref:HlyD family secretion protein n=1 Tax=Alishewanella sp. HL-SH05 TaxID=3461145 RepID=UPI004041736B